MTHPLLYEINTRCWLRELSETRGAAITLANVPPAEFAAWRRLGFTHIWLMGVWKVGPRTRDFSRRHPAVREACARTLPDLREADITGSPYAIAGYTVAPSLGGETGLRKFRERLATHELKLILDFIPNHTGLDHPWLSARPELYVQGPANSPGLFRHETSGDPRWMAHGRDPYFPPWADTAQLDYRNAATRSAMIAELQSVASRCDGVRCDMTMLVLSEVFAKNWAALPCPVPAPATEFWTDAIAAVRRTAPHFLFLAEVYWGLEERLQALGFNFTYDKRMLDHLVERKPGELARRLRDATPEFLRASAHFIENHDEPRVAARLSLAEHRAAALVTLGLPGMRLLHEGQLTGASRHVSVHLARRPGEEPQREIGALYELLLPALATTAVGRGLGVLLQTLPAWDGNPTAENYVIVQWQSTPLEFDLVVANLAPHRSQCYARLAIAGLDQHSWRLTDLIGEDTFIRRGDELEQRGLYLDLPAHGAQLFHCRPAD